MDTLLIKLGSIAVHCEKIRGKNGHTFDLTALDSLLSDPEVRAFLDNKENSVFLPLKRTMADVLLKNGQKKATK